MLAFYYPSVQSARAAEGKTSPTSVMWPSQLGLQNIPTASLQRVRLTLPNECPKYDTNQSDGDAPVMVDIWGMWSTPSLA